MPLEEVNRAFELMEAQDGIRSVLDVRRLTRDGDVRAANVCARRW